MGVSVLGLGKKEGNLPEIPDIDRAEVQSFYHPIVLGVTIPVLVCPQSVGDTLNRVNDRAGKIVSGIDLPLLAITCCELGRVGRKRGNSPRAMMGQDITPVYDRVAHSFVGVIDANLGSNTPFETILGSGFHLLEVF